MGRIAEPSRRGFDTCVLRTGRTGDGGFEDRRHLHLRPAPEHDQGESMGFSVASTLAFSDRDRVRPCDRATDATAWWLPLVFESAENRQLFPNLPRSHRCPYRRGLRAHRSQGQPIGNSLGHCWKAPRSRVSAGAACSRSWNSIEANQPAINPFHRIARRAFMRRRYRV